MQKVTPFIWFDKDAEEAAQFYVDLFNGNPGKKKASKVGSVLRNDENSTEGTGMSAGTVLTVEFNLEDQNFTALNGGAQDWAKPSGRISFVVDCKAQEEIDYFWDKLSADGGEAGQCGWINHDRYGTTWQIVPRVLIDYLGSKDAAAAGRTMKAMMQMTKLDIATLKKAYEGSD